MSHKGDYICSVSKLTAWLCKIAAAMGVEILHGFAAEDIIWDAGQHLALGIKLKDQGLDKHGQKQPNYLPGEVIRAKSILIAEGCDGLLAEKFISTAGLVRQANQLYSLGVKELIRVSESQYARFGSGRVVHAMGYPIWDAADWAGNVRRRHYVSNGQLPYCRRNDCRARLQILRFQSAGCFDPL
jgi:electron-transferring-flavoprotein dehydrogenase